MECKDMDKEGYALKIIKWLSPNGSRREVLLHIITQVVTHPRQMAIYMKPYKIKRFFYYLFHDGLKGVKRVLDDRVLMGSDLKLQISVSKLVESKTIEEYPKINFEEEDEPQVSIIIPVHNQFNYTYACLKAIKKNTINVKYEVIVADDCSNDLTTQIQKVAENILVVRTEHQSYFIKNCNNAAKYAKGKYILFLNNDTQVQNDWLFPMIKLFKDRVDTGIVGSCFVYPDGKLQEAGGIIWKDGSAWNYGNGKNPAMPEYRYVKEVDYISGASIMIKKELWDQIGGFDERFAPAYCEDSDLAFTIRQLGYKVLYQPASVVVHFEGISNGKNETRGVKAYQIENKKRLYEKWKAVFLTEQLESGEDCFLARDRSQNKKRILIFDHRVPCYDKDAGSRTVMMYIKLFLKQGFKVVFLPDDFYPLQPYTNEMAQMGVEVLYGNYYMNHWKEWLEENLKYFQYIYMNRPQVSIKYIDIIKKHCSGRIIYYGHDLHYLREEREYEITHNPEVLRSAKRWKSIENQLFEKADVIYAAGNYEYTILRNKLKNKTIRSVPAYIYPELKCEDNFTLDGRKNLLFVGGFGHPPNLDAVLWFGKKIFPEILKIYPDMIWNIVGSNPPQEVLNLQSANIKVLGFVSDEKLRKLYRYCRLAVIPLRYGAGVKGKVVECIYNECPLITTYVGAEGIELDQRIFKVVEADDNMAKEIVDLYKDDNALLSMMRYSSHVINAYFTEKSVLKIIANDFDMEGVKD